MFEFPMFPGEVLRSEAALYGCATCPEEWGPCPDQEEGIPTR